MSLCSHSIIFYFNNSLTDCAANSRHARIYENYKFTQIWKEDLEVQQEHNKTELDN